MHWPPKVDEQIQKKSGPKNGTVWRSRFWDRKVPMKRIAKDSRQRSQKWDRQTVPFLGPHLLQNIQKRKYDEQEDDYDEDSEQNESGEFEGSPFMRLALHDM